MIGFVSLELISQRYRFSTYGLSCDISLPVLCLEGIDKALVEAAELRSKLDFVGNVRCALTVANPDRLLDPKHVGQVGPRVRVLNRGERAGLPGEGAVFGQETGERRTARSAIEPETSQQSFARVGSGFLTRSSLPRESVPLWRGRTRRRAFVSHQDYLKLGATCECFVSLEA